MTSHTGDRAGPADLDPAQLPRLGQGPWGAHSTPGGWPAPDGRSTTIPSDTPPATRERLLDVLLRQCWTICYTITGLLTAIAALTLAGLAVAGFFSLPGLGVGLLLLVPALWGSWLLGRAERHRIAAFLGVDIGHRPESAAPRWRRFLGLDEQRLRSLGWVGIHGLWGLFCGVVTLVLLTRGLLLGTLPLWGWMTEGVTVIGPLRATTTVEMTVAWLLGVAVLVALPWVARGLSSVDVALARWLIGTDAQAQLQAMTARVDTLTTTREGTLDSVEAERRRIERDLHDGPQQRLVSIAMTLGLARDALDREPENPGSARTVRALLDEAHASSKEAITEMRQVARGIVPPILTDRGLDAAVSALAVRSAVPVSVRTRLPEGRLDPTVEAIAYFSVSEALTNVAKHSRATRATVDLSTSHGRQGEQVVITVTDDGVGGALIGAGSGLTGLRQRVAAVDGQLDVLSTEGSGTTVAITLPLRERTTT